MKLLPFQFFHEEGLHRIASLVGKPQCLNPSTANKTNLEVAKVLTIIDPRKPLQEAVNVQFDSGEIRRVLVSSPWMPLVCAHCKELGHSLRHCRSAPITCSSYQSTTHLPDACPQNHAQAPKKRRSHRRRRSKTPAPSRMSDTLSTSIATTSQPPRGRSKALQEWQVKSTGEANEKPSVQDSNHCDSQLHKGQQPQHSQAMRLSETLPPQLTAKASDQESLQFSQATPRTANTISPPHEPSVIVGDSDSGSQLQSDADIEPDSSDIPSTDSKEARFTRVLSKRQRKIQRASHRRGFKKWFRARKPIFGGLIETHVKQPKEVKFINNLLPGWFFEENYSFSELRKIWVIWDSSVQVVVVEKSLQMVTCEVLFPGEQSWIVVSIVYAANEAERELWLEIVALGASQLVSSRPWIVMGDFNQILNPHEHSEQPSLNVDRRIRDFRSCLLDAELTDLTYKGNFFTWWNKNESRPIAKKLDRILVSKKLKALKRPIKEFSKSNYSDLEKRTREAHEVLLSRQNRTLADPSTTNATLELEAQRTWASLAAAEESFFLQKSRVTWFAEGDGNTRYFHRMTNARKSINSIHSLTDDNGNRYKSQEEISEYCADYFANLLNDVQEPYTMEQEDMNLLLSFRCSPEQATELEKQFSDEDIKAAFFSLPKNKACGPNGFPVEFYKEASSVVGPEVTTAIREFFTSGCLLKQWNSTTLVLIPKTANASSAVDFRPISCLNTLYKVIAKLLTNRLQSLPASVISLSQSAFLPGRSLSENVLLATELVHGYNWRNISPRGMLKVDLRKAFNTVRWEFVIADLGAIQVPDRFGFTNASPPPLSRSQ
ncbi:PREDICTED: uncharacterized protein LOC109125477 [Camelina sativa]|uniref:Uncharacterized protein LOC109125477 n=1 Tax=Camelina sativa TaxID=90675 RepID=A0ABM1Q7B6_CAMSA|nr:PREDICTED: uncharacterized protein LOC109125477 [Camelina sativa]